MTDKIIIDGTDVSECPAYMSNLGRYNCIALGHNGGNTCEKSPNCYYKQLKRKEQECEQLKEKIEKLENNTNYDIQKISLNILKDIFKNA